jgi:hypothetical protein
MKKSNRFLAKRLNNINRMSFCKYTEAHLKRLSCLKTIYYDIHDIFPTDSNYVYRAVINKNNSPFDSIDRIAFNPTPQYIHRANLLNQGIGYYACASDISIIEVCQDNLKTTDTRFFDLTVSKWKIKEKIPVQIICHSKQTQSAGTDLMEFYIATSRKRRKDLPRKEYRKWFLKMKFIANQYAKTNIGCEKDYFISAWHSKNILSHSEIDCIIYPSVPYTYKGFNYAFSPNVFKNQSVELEEVSHFTVQFDKDKIKKYPKIDLVKSTQNFDGDKIVW